MSGIDHIFLFTLLFLLFYLWGIYAYKIKSSLNYFTFALLPILVFSFIVGSRYGWGADYMFYKYRLDRVGFFEEEQLGFKLLNQSINSLGFNYVGGYIVYSLIFISCATFLLRSYGYASKYMYAFLIPSTLLFPTSIIRQGVAISFVFLALYFYNKKNWLGIAISIIVAMSIHTTVLINAVMIGVIVLFFKKPFSWKITIPIYVYLTFLFDVSKIGVISQYIEMISLDNQFQSYVDSSDHWFGQDAADAQFQQSGIALTLSALFHTSLIYLGYWALVFRPNRNVTVVYNSLVIGLIGLRAVFLFEILKRFFQPLVMLYFVVLGYILFVFIQSKYKKKITDRQSYSDLNHFLLIKKQFWVLFGCIMLYLLMFWGRFIFLNEESGFFWDQ